MRENNVWHGHQIRREAKVRWESTSINHHGYQLPEPTMMFLFPCQKTSCFELERTSRSTDATKLALVGHAGFCCTACNPGAELPQYIRSWQETLSQLLIQAGHRRALQYTADAEHGKNATLLVQLLYPETEVNWLNRAVHSHFSPKAQEAFNLVSEIRPRWFYENGGTKGNKKRDKEERANKLSRKSKEKKEGYKRKQIIPAATEMRWSTDAVTRGLTKEMEFSARYLG